MPSSQFFYISYVLDLIHSAPHNSILDIGPGFGKYGVLCREYFDLIPTWYEKSLSGFEKKNWQTKIDCIEVFESYITPLHQYIYDNIHLGKAEEVIRELSAYDIILLIGIIEHIEKDAGKLLLEECQKKAHRIILVTPEGYAPQDAVWDNPHEEHKSGWSTDELIELKFKVMILPGGKILAYWDRRDASGFYYAS